MPAAVSSFVSDHLYGARCSGLLKQPFSKSRQAEIFMVLVACAWGIAFVFMKDLLNAGFSAFALVAVRFLLAGVLVAVCFYNRLLALTWMDFRKGLILGVFLALSFILMIAGLQYTKASITGFLAATSIIWVPIIELVVFKKALPVKALICIIACLLGTYILTQGVMSGIDLGAVLVLLGTLSFSILIILIDVLSPMENPNIISIQLLVTGVLAGFIGLLLHQLTIPATFSVNVMAQLLAVVVLGTAFTVWAQTRYQHFIAPTRAAFIFLLEPIFTLIFSIWLLREGLTLEEVIGSVIIMFSVACYIKQ